MIEAVYDAVIAPKKSGDEKVEENPEFGDRIDLGPKISPELRKTPTEPEDVISGYTRDRELCWVETALEDGTKVASGVRSESKCPDLAKIGCAKVVKNRNSWEEFQDLEKSIKDPPDATEDDDDPEWNPNKTQKNSDHEREKIERIERLDSPEVNRKEQSFHLKGRAVIPQKRTIELEHHQEVKSPMDTEKKVEEGGYLKKKS